MKRALLCGLMMFLPALSMAGAEQLLDFDQLMHALRHGEEGAAYFYRVD